MLEGKGGKRRTVYFQKTTKKGISRYLNQSFKSDSDPLFTSDRGLHAGEALARSGVLQLVKRLGRKAGLSSRRCSPHVFRHTSAVQFLRSGGNQLALKEILGHESLRMTDKYVNYAAADIARQHKKFSPVEWMVGLYQS